MPFTQKKLKAALFLEWITSASYSTLFLTWLAIALTFGLAYFLLGFLPGQGPIHFKSASGSVLFWDSIYFSFNTATAIGYGDITPQGTSKILASMEGILALFTFAVFVTKLVSYRNEIALRQVHKLTFEDVFYNTREGLFIVRKDCDRILEILEHKGSMSDDDWEDLQTTYKQTQSLLAEIPDFYDADDSHLYTIDRRREQLLQESVHRTLHRINELLDRLSKAGVDWVSQEGSVTELRELIRVIDEVTPLWMERSPYHKEEAFEDILHLKESIQKRIDKALPVENQ